MPEVARKQYKVLIERDDDGFFVASVPALPGCYTQAKNLTELKLRVRDAIKLCLNVARENRPYRQRIKQFSYELEFVGLESVTP